MFCLLLILGLVVPAYLRPQQDAAVPAHVASVGSGSTPIPIVSQTEEINPDGSFKFSYETGNGIKYEESGYLKDNATEKVQVIQGSVSYTDNEGNVINLKYIADENGYQPEGDHIPTSPPVPEGIARALKSLPVDDGIGAEQAQPVGASHPQSVGASHPQSVGASHPQPTGISQSQSAGTPQPARTLPTQGVSEPAAGAPVSASAAATPGSESEPIGQ